MRGVFDLLDRRIIRLLQGDGRVSSAEIARQLHVSERTVRNRVYRLVDSGAIRPTVIVNHKLFGYQVFIDVFCEVDINRMDEIGQVIAGLPEVNYVAYSTGDQDISVQVLLESSDSVYDIIQKLAGIPGVRRTKTVLLTRIIKDTYQWIPPEDDFEDYGEELPLE